LSEIENQENPSVLWKFCCTEKAFSTFGSITNVEYSSSGKTCQRVFVGVDISFPGTSQATKMAKNRFSAGKQKIGKMQYPF